MSNAEPRRSAAYGMLIGFGVLVDWGFAPRAAGGYRLEYNTRLEAIYLGDGGGGGWDAFLLEVFIPFSAPSFWSSANEAFPLM